MGGLVLRKEWDSNPRYGKAVRRISSPVHSITLASFRIAAAKIMHFLQVCQRPERKTEAFLICRQLLDNLVGQFGIVRPDDYARELR